MDAKIIKCNGDEWYKDCIERRFRVHSESRKGGKGKFVVRIERSDRCLVGGYMYGWIKKEHCQLLEPIDYEFVTTEFGDYLKETIIKD